MAYLVFTSQSFLLFESVEEGAVWRRLSYSVIQHRVLTTKRKILKWICLHSNFVLVDFDSLAEWLVDSKGAKSLFIVDFSKMIRETTRRHALNDAHEPHNQQDNSSLEEIVIMLEGIIMARC